MHLGPSKTNGLISLTEGSEKLKSI